MAIKQITQKEYNRVKQNRKMGTEISANWPGIYFRAPNKKYYLQNDNTPNGAKEIVEFNKKIKKKMLTQMSLF